MRPRWHPTWEGIDAVTGPRHKTKPAAAVDYKAEMARLHEAARQEGTLVLYSSMNVCRAG